MSRLAILALLAALAPLPLAFARPAEGVTARAVPLDPRDPGRTMLGPLRYRGGWVLTGGARRFGGISSLTIQDGRMVLLSDTGVVIRFRFAGTGVQPDYAEFPLPAVPGGGRLRKASRDSESSTWDPVSRHVWAGFESRNEIWRYTAGFGAADGHVAPAAMADWPGNEGAEAMVRLRDGRFLVFAETKTRDDGSHLVLLFPGDPVAGATPIRFGLRGPDGFSPTDAVQLPDGRVLVLMRRFSAAKGLLSLTPGFSAALVLIDPAAIRPDLTLESRPVARLAPPLTVDNMEALAVEQRDGHTIVWMASDDNFFVAQRTLLLAFEWPAQL